MFRSYDCIKHNMLNMLYTANLELLAVYEHGIYYSQSAPRTDLYHSPTSSNSILTAYRLPPLLRTY